MYVVYLTLQPSPGSKAKRTASRQGSPVNKLPAPSPVKADKMPPAYSGGAAVTSSSKHAAMAPVVAAVVAPGGGAAAAAVAGKHYSGATTSNPYMSSPMFSSSRNS